MSKRICVADGCSSVVRARGLCPKHYERRRVALGGTVQSKPCKGCGQPIRRENHSAPIRDFCGPDCRPRCSIIDCDEPASSRGWCAFHYSRWRLTGDPEQMYERVYYPEGALCAFPGCDGKRRKLEWCNSHYGQYRRGVELRPLVKWSRRKTCISCGEPTGRASGMRKFCSVNCQQLYYRHGGPPPETFTCTQCSGTFPFEVPGRSRINRTVRFCTRCRQDIHKHKISVRWLAARDGTDCGICGASVDMDLKFPDQMRPSVDHIIARANGGTNDPENLQLAHLWCNQVKSNRPNFTLVELPMN